MPDSSFVERFDLVAVYTPGDAVPDTWR